MFPRLLAIAELGWTPRERRLWADFRRRVNSQIPRLLARGVNAFTLSNDVEITARIVREGRKARVTLDTEKYPAEVRYTLDGSDPTAGSDIYSGPFVVEAGTTVKAACLSEGNLPAALPGSMSMRAIMWRIIMPTWKLPRYMLRRTADWIGFRCAGTALGRERNGIKVKYVKK